MAFRRRVRDWLRPLFPLDAQVRHGYIDAPMQKGTQVFIVAHAPEMSVHDEANAPDENGAARRTHNCLTRVDVHIFNDDPDVCEDVAIYAMARRSADSFRERSQEWGFSIVSSRGLGMVPIADVRSGGVTYRPRSIISFIVEWRHSYYDNVGLIENIEIVGDVEDDKHIGRLPLTLTLKKGEIHGE